MFYCTPKPSATGNTAPRRACALQRCGSHDVAFAKRGLHGPGATTSGCCADCRFEDHASFAVLAGTDNQFQPSLAALERCTFVGTVASGDSDAAVRAFGEGAEARVQGCTFDENDADVYTSKRYSTIDRSASVIYTDAAGLVRAPLSKGFLRPLADAPVSFNRLTESNPAFVTLRTVCLPHPVPCMPVQCLSVLQLLELPAKRLSIIVLFWAFEPFNSSVTSTICPY